MKIERKGKRNPIDSLLIISLLGFIAVLLAYAYMGSFMRTIGDDYCLGGTLQKHGLWGGWIYSYFNPVPYHGNRFTLIFLSLLSSLFQPSFNGVIPSVTIAIFVAGIFLLADTMLTSLKIHISKWVNLMISLAIVFFTFIMSPTIKQNLYWRTGMLSTLAPVIGNIYLIVLVLRVKSPRWMWALFIFIFSIVNAGITENGAVYQAMTGLVVLSLGFFNRDMEGEKRTTLLLNSVIVILGSLIAVFIMWISPSISHMKETIDISIIAAIKMSLTHSIDFYTGAFSSLYLGTMAITFLGFLTFFIISQFIEYKDLLKRIKLVFWIIMLFISQTVTLLLIFSLMVPSAFTRNTYPDPRHLIGGIFALVVNFFFTGFCVAGFFRGLAVKINRFATFEKYLVSGSVILLFIFSFVYPVRYISKVTSERQLFKYWAFQWDHRHEQILQAVNSGVREVHVMTLDHIIEGVGELSPVYETNWYNLCAADFYKLHRISADKPGWEEGFQEFITSEK